MALFDDSDDGRAALPCEFERSDVVNGDADLVVAFGYCVAGEQSFGEVKAEGAIDQKAVRDRITAVMEGGEKAFNLRKEKYGF